MQGSCLCAAVRYQIDGDVVEAHHCHCSACRKAHGAAFSTFAAVPASGLRILEGRDQLAVYRSSPPVERTFCRVCGASLLYAHDAVPALIWIALGTLDSELPAAARPDAHLHVARQASWWTIHDGLPRYAEGRPDAG